MKYATIAEFTNDILEGRKKRIALLKVAPTLNFTRKSLLKVYRSIF